MRVTSGANGGGYRFDCASGDVSWERGEVDDLPAVFEADPGSLVLTITGRISAGTIRGDAAVFDRFRALVFPI